MILTPVQLRYKPFLLVYMVSNYILPKTHLKCQSSQASPGQINYMLPEQLVHEASAAMLITQHRTYLFLAPKPSLHPTQWSTSRPGSLPDFFQSTLDSLSSCGVSFSLSSHGSPNHQSSSTSLPFSWTMVSKTCPLLLSPASPGQ